MGVEIDEPGRVDVIEGMVDESFGCYPRRLFGYSSGCCVNAPPIRSMKQPENSKTLNSDQSA